MGLSHALIKITSAVIRWPFAMQIMRDKGGGSRSTLAWSTSIATHCNCFRTYL